MIGAYNNSSDQLRRPNSEYRDKYTTLPITSILWELSHSVYAKHDCVAQNFPWLTYRETFEISTARMLTSGLFRSAVGKFSQCVEEMYRPGKGGTFLPNVGKELPNSKAQQPSRPVSSIRNRYTTHEILASFLVGTGNLRAKLAVHFFVVFSSHYTRDMKCSSYYLLL
jgi:hypothetical protein